MYKKRSDFDDELVRKFVIDVFKKTFNIKLISNKKWGKIDLLLENNPNFGVEVERGGWFGDFWINDAYSLLTNTGFRTVNIPIRKEKYWMDIVRKKPNLGAEHNLYVRTNHDFTQFIIVRPITIRDKSKVYRTRFKPRNKDHEEDWLSFKREDSETYNLIDGKFILDEYDKERAEDENFLNNDEAQNELQSLMKDFKLRI